VNEHDEYEWNTCLRSLGKGRGTRQC